MVEWSGGFYTAVTEMFGLKFWWRHEPSIRDMFWALSIDAEHLVDRVDTLRRPPPRIAPHAGTLMKALEYSKVHTHNFYNFYHFYDFYNFYST